MLLEIFEQILRWKLYHDKVRFRDIKSFIQVFNFNFFIVSAKENNIFTIMTFNKAYIAFTALNKDSFINFSI
jgi:hypothetical protein